MMLNHKYTSCERGYSSSHMLKGGEGWYSSESHKRVNTESKKILFDLYRISKENGGDIQQEGVQRPWSLGPEYRQPHVVELLHLQRRSKGNKPTDTPVLPFQLDYSESFCCCT